jgi:NAD(P)-dependent dehydrogenase (short-subunit alcohol dehydrogenase family)
LRAVKVIHTAAWFSIETCMLYVLYAGFARRSDRRAGIAAAVVAAESLVFAGTGFRCPLTQVAERLGAERGSVTDIYLPKWLARSLPAIHVPLIGLAGYLHARNLRAETASSRPGAAVPDLAGVTAVVTGASSGIGLEVTRGLARCGAHVVLGVRSAGRGQSAASAILETSPRASLEVLALDLADLASVRRFAGTLRARHGALGLLVNNAGVASPALRHTADGFELDFGTNHLGHFALTGLLLPALTASPQARVITVTSMAHRRGGIGFADLDGSKAYSPARAYSQSKLANVLFAYELQRRLSKSAEATLSVACHPGWAATAVTLGSAGERPRLTDRAYHLLARRFAPSAAKGAEPVLFAATSPGVRGGDFIGPGGRLGVPSSDGSHDENLARHLWQVSEHMTGVRYHLPAA